MQQVLPHLPGIQQHLPRQGKVQAHDFQQIQSQTAAIDQQSPGTGHHGCQGIELFGAGDLALVPGVLFALLRGVFCFVLTALALGHG
ncbi:hypothetical protein D9M70_634970 [compost metagenome]